MSANSAPTFDLDQLPMQPGAGAPAPNMQLKGGRRRKSGVRKSGRRKSGVRKSGVRKSGRRRTSRRMRYN